MSEQLLARAVRSLSTTVDGGRAMADLAQVLVPEAADWCLVDLLEPPDLVTRVVALGAAGPLDLPAEHGDVQARRSSAQAAGILSRLVDAPGRRLRLTAADLAAAAGSPDLRTRRQAELAQTLGTAEVLVLGLVNGDDLLGVLSVGRCGRGFEHADAERLSDVASAAGLALSGVRLRELQRSVSTALQRSLLPPLPVVPGLALAARFVPAVQGLAVGGDWYDAFPLPDRSVAVVVGDATGHDAQAAARMAELRNLLRGTAVDAQQPPADTLSRLDRVIDHLTPELSGTCVYVQLDLAGRRLRWSSAGHLPPVLLRDGAAELLETQPDLMLGVRADTERVDHERDLQAGDVLVLYTDGLVEERRTPLDARLEAVRQAVQELSGRDVEQVADALVRQLPSGDDDVAVLVLHVEP
jgi:serine phosphatase RsbU (regulator of sigma subunit)